ncbi:MAG: SNF2-related protein [Rheinheimera sp.]|nr:SNF2-related protein [Rheinheimera sp.]
MQSEREAGRLKAPVLIICPTSLLGNWQQEAERFTPDLRVLQVYGSKRAHLFENLTDYDLLVTTYPLIVRDIAVYQRFEIQFGRA